MWNKRRVPVPPHCTLPITITTSHTAVLGQLKSRVGTAESVLTMHKSLQPEQDLLNRLVYKLNNQFRSDKTQKGLKMMKSCLRRFEEIDIAGVLKGLEGLAEIDTNQGESDVYMGTRQMLEYHLVKLQGVAALVRQTLNYSRLTYIHSRYQLQTGNLIPQNLIILGLTSRIWVLQKSFLHHVLGWYASAFSCRTILPATSVPWLHAGEELPANLGEWLESNFPFHAHEQAHSEEQLEVSLDMDADVINELEESTSTQTGPSAALLQTSMEDLGEPVKRKQTVTEDTVSEPTRKKQKLDYGKNEQEVDFRDNNSMHNRCKAFIAEIDDLPRNKIFTMVKKFKECAKCSPQMFGCSKKELKAGKRRIEGLLAEYKDRKSSSRKSAHLDKTFSDVRTVIAGLLGAENSTSQSVSNSQQSMVSTSTDISDQMDARPTVDHPMSVPVSLTSRIRGYVEKDIVTTDDILMIVEQLKTQNQIRIHHHLVQLSPSISKQLVKKLKLLSRIFTGKQSAGDTEGRMGTVKGDIFKILTSFLAGGAESVTGLLNNIDKCPVESNQTGDQSLKPPAIDKTRQKNRKKKQKAKLTKQLAGNDSCLNKRPKATCKPMKKRRKEKK